MIRTALPPFVITAPLFAVAAWVTACGATSSSDDGRADADLPNVAGATSDAAAGDARGPAPSPAPADASARPPLGDFGPAPNVKPGRVAVGVRNGCADALWIHAAGEKEVLQPDDAKLAQGDVRWYDAPAEWTAARITAFAGGPRTRELEKVEMTFTSQGGKTVLNYNITYVDWLGLPVVIESVGSGADCKPVGCYAKRSETLAGCPSGLSDGDRCVAARTYCLEPGNRKRDVCKSLDAEITRCASTKAGCAGAAGSGTPEVFACSGAFFSKEPKWCAALNRGMLDDPESTSTKLYYTKPPFNAYAQWVHQVCPGIYAFPYDDYPAQAAESGFHACEQGRELRITFCPSG